MRCLHCKQRLNVFKSLTGSSFCSQEHKKLYEAGQANTAFERLLEFVEQDAKPSPDRAKPTAPPAPQPSRQPAEPAPLAPEPQTVAGKAEKAADPAPEPPVAGFLLEPVAAPVPSASSNVNAKFEILESGFPSSPPALPSLRIEITATDLQKLASEPSEKKPAEVADALPPPLASWLSPSPAAVDAPLASIEVPAVGPVRPRVIALAEPSPQNRPLGIEAPPFLFSSDPRGLQLSIQAVGDTPDFANLARLNPLHQEPRTVNEKAQKWSAKSGVPALSQTDAMELSVLPQAKLGRDDSDASLTVDINGALTRTGVGGNVSALPAHPPQPPGTLGVSAVPGRILAGVQDVSGSGQAPVFPARLKYHPSAMHWPAAQSAVASLPRGVFSILKLAPGDRLTPAAMATSGAMMRAGVARAVRQPQPPSSRLASSLGSSEIVKQVIAGVQNAPGPGDYAISSARLAQPEYVAPRLESARPGPAGGIGRVIAHRRVAIRESDSAAAAGITNVTTPAAVTRPLAIPVVPSSRRSITVAVDRTARRVLVQVQAKDDSQGCAISFARPARRDCLLPAILWSARTCLRSAIASVGWFHESDCPGQAFPSATSATRLFSIRFAPEALGMDAPAIAVDRTTRRLLLEVCEGKSELAKSELETQRLARARPSGSSPLSLVALPAPGLATLAVRSVASLNQFTSISNPAQQGAAPPRAASASAGDYKPTLTLPQFAFGLFFEFRLASQGAAKSTPIGAADRKSAATVPGPRPSPLRVQPASILVLPGFSIPIRRLRWGASGGWATVSSPSVPNLDQSQASEEGSLPSLPRLADALRADSAVIRESVTLRLNPTRPRISLDIGAQIAASGIQSANALPRRRGPKLPVLTTQLDGPIVTNR